MKIAFKKITPSGVPFEVDLDSLRFSGSLKKDSKHLVTCEGELQGSLQHQCDRCAEPMTLSVDEKLKLYFHEGIYEGEENLDIIEFFEQEIDFEEVIKSEIASIKSGYFYCNGCSE